MKHGLAIKLALKSLNMVVHYLVIVCLMIGGCLGLAFSVHAERGLSLGKKEQTITDKQGKEVILYKESHVLVIGVSNYTNGWPELPGVRRDVREVTAILEAQGFNVVVEMDLDKIALDEAFNNFINRYG